MRSGSKRFICFVVVSAISLSSVFLGNIQTRRYTPQATSELSSGIIVGKNNQTIDHLGKAARRSERENFQSADHLQIASKDDQNSTRRESNREDPMDNHQTTSQEDHIHEVQNSTTSQPDEKDQASLRSSVELQSESALECQLTIEAMQNKRIAHWLNQSVPIVHNAISMHNKVFIFMGGTIPFYVTYYNINDFKDADWYCGNKNQTSRLAFGKGVNVLECPNDPEITHIWPSIPSNKTGEVPVYDIRPYLNCNRLADQEFKTHTGKAKVGACMITAGEQSRSRIHEWVSYHKLLGIDHAWIHINEPFNHSLMLPELPFVTYVPFNFRAQDHIPTFRQMG